MADFQSIILDHLNIGVTDIVRSISFYQAALAPLGMQKFFDIDASRTESKQKIAGFGRENDRPVFWLIDKQTELQMEPAADIRLSELLDRQQAGILTDRDRSELQLLMETYQEGLLRKATALSEAVKRKLIKPLSE